MKWNERKETRKEYLYNYNCLTNFRIKHSSSDGHWEGFLPLREKNTKKTERKCIFGELLLLLLLFLGSHLTKKKRIKTRKEKKVKEKIGENRFLKIIKIIFGSKIYFLFRI